MPVTITMPRLSDTMEEGTLVKWHVGVEDQVSSGQHLADVETDKATMELQAFDEGTVAKMPIDEGQTVPVGELILVLAAEGESVDEAAQQAAGGGGAESGAPEGEAKREPTGETSQAEPAGEGRAAAPPQPAEQKREEASAGEGQRLRVSPLAKKLAREKGLALSRIKGSGPDGRIIRADIERAEAEGGAPAAAPAAEAQPATAAAPAPAEGPALEARSLPVSNMRKTIAKRLVQSKQTIPHFTVTTGIDMDPLLELRKTLNSQLESQGIKLSVGDFVTRAAALACTQHPAVNSSWQEQTIEQHGTVNMGVAVALPEERGGGLIVPVIRDVQQRGLRSISQQTKWLAKKAREQGLSQQEMEGGTFTISNLGMFGLDHFEAIINPPQAAILAVGAANEKPVVKNGQIVIGHEMAATLSGDHRVVDGAIGAAYLQTLKEMLENPAGLLV